MSRLTGLTVLCLAALLVPVVATEGKRKKRPPISTSLVSCGQSSVSATEDEFEAKMRARAARRSNDRRAAAAATPPPLAGATIAAKLEGPYVQTKTASGSTNGKGIAKVTLSFGGPGEYTLSWTATKTGYKTGKGTATITVTGPMNGPCNLS
jgi:hypothetical protein